MKISTQTLLQLNQLYQSAPDPVADGIDTLVQKIGAQLGAVEGVTDFGSKYQGIIIARVVECEKHPNADRLSVCLIDDGGIAEDIDRSEEGYVQVVCGAPNVRAGLLVAWLPPGSIVPDSFDTEPFVLAARALRGVLSNGMLASPKELAISDMHDGILEIDGDFVPGTLFIDAFNLRDDAVIEIENKMFTHRPDCFGWLGVARELAGINQQHYTSPEWYINGEQAIYSDDVKSTAEAPLRIQNDIPELVPRFIAVTLSDVQIGPSPVWLQLDLARHGIRPINNVVDISNYVMLLTGQPLHAYDYDKVRGLSSDIDTAVIGARYPHEEETITLLNGKDITPRSEAILITASEKAIGLGGVMGGGETEVSETTTRIILECASFDMYSIRRTAMAHGIFTDAVTRFSKGQSPLQNKQVAEYATKLLQDLAGAKLVAFHDAVAVDTEQPTVTLDVSFINERLGMEFTAEEAARLLWNVEFAVTTDATTLSVSVPFWRTDIAIAEDIVEEVGRLYGYDALPMELPKRSITPTPVDTMLSLKQRIRERMACYGANETLAYSFVHGNLLEKVGQDPAKAFRLSNALSPDLQYYRLSLTPSLLDKVHMNIKSGYDEFALFEIGKGHAIDAATDALPDEWQSLAYVYAANDKRASEKSGASYFQAQYMLDTLLSALGITYTLRAETEFPEQASFAHMLMVFESGRVASVWSGEHLLGYVGEFHHHAQQALKLPRYAAGFELSLEMLLAFARSTARYAPLSRFPRVEQDITLRVSLDTTHTMLREYLEQLIADEVSEQETYEVLTHDIYQAVAADVKHVTFRLRMTHHQKTLTDTEVNALIGRVCERAKDELGVERI